MIEVETRYITAKRDAEAEQIKRITEGGGQAQGKERMADATAYETRVNYEAEAKGVQKVRQALSRASAAYLEYVPLSFNGAGSILLTAAVGESFRSSPSAAPSLNPAWLR